MEELKTSLSELNEAFLQGIRGEQFPKATEVYDTLLDDTKKFTKIEDKFVNFVKQFSPIDEHKYNLLLPIFNNPLSLILHKINFNVFLGKIIVLTVSLNYGLLEYIRHVRNIEKFTRMKRATTIWKLILAKISSKDLLTINFTDRWHILGRNLVHMPIFGLPLNEIGPTFTLGSDVKNLPFGSAKYKLYSYSKNLPISTNEKYNPPAFILNPFYEDLPPIPPTPRSLVTTPHENKNSVERLRDQVNYSVNVLYPGYSIENLLSDIKECIPS